MDDKPTFTFAESGKYTVSNAGEFSGALYTKPNYKMTFSNSGGVIGTLDFNGPEMVFTGKAEESAKVFFDWVAVSFAQRLKEEREWCAQQVDYILREGGGTYGDYLRKGK